MYVDHDGTCQLRSQLTNLLICIQLYSESIHTRLKAQTLAGIKRYTIWHIYTIKSALLAYVYVIITWNEYFLISNTWITWSGIEKIICFHIIIHAHFSCAYFRKGVFWRLNAVHVYIFLVSELEAGRLKVLRGTSRCGAHVRTSPKHYAKTR